VPQLGRVPSWRGAAGAVGAACFLVACLGADAQNGGPKFDSSRAWEHLRRQVAFGPRPSGSAAIAENRRYIIEQLKAAGIESREQAFEGKTPVGPVKMANVIATIPGSRPERIALGTHFDTKLYREFRFVGASDGASSTAVVLELARLLKQRKNAYTIELLFFDGEEAVNAEWRDPDNRYGSRHYVQQAQTSGTLSGLKALVLLDLVGDRNLNFKRDSNSTRWLTDIIWAAAKKLGYSDQFWPEETAIEDDHIPFLRAGVAAVDLIDLDYPAWHTARDTLDAVSARSLQIVGDVVLASLPDIEMRLSAQK
jgi:glutaminyl-peptide cyclotransferase